MMISIWLIGGLIMLSLGIVGEYVGKIYMESKHRPRYRIENHTVGGRRPADGPSYSAWIVSILSSSYESTRIAMPLLEAKIRPSPFSCLAITKR